jgi:hypothetical protein
MRILSQDAGKVHQLHWKASAESKKVKSSLNRNLDLSLLPKMRSSETDFFTVLHTTPLLF